ncbi:nuclear transport factor 2 family protein [Methyloceanibacter sp.]|uniref:nuclear transport factor 2 family protein n=1 Tax=Methyloceanibacter sp. TaxID=1965321 RepID=UPI003D6C984A
MTGRQAIEDLLEELYAARVRGDLETITRLFAPNATFQVAGTDDASPMPTLVKGNAGIRSLMQGMIANFEVSDFTINEMLIDGPSAAVRWQASFLYTKTGQMFSGARRLHHRGQRPGHLLHRVSRYRARRQGACRQIAGAPPPC